MIIESLMNSSVRRLSHVYRYISVPTIRRESIDEHIAYVSLYALIIAKDLIKSGHNVNLSILLERTLVHDLDESITGDVIRTVKYGHPDLKRVLDEVATLMMARLDKSLGVSLSSAWRDAKGVDLEGAILEVVDLFQVISYVSEEIDLGNRHLLNILPECCNYVRQVIEHRSDSPIVPYAKEILEWATEFYDMRASS